MVQRKRKLNREISDMKEKCGKAARACMKSNDVVTGRIRWVLNNINEQRRDTNREKQKSQDVLSSSMLASTSLSSSSVSKDMKDLGELKNQVVWNCGQVLLGRVRICCRAKKTVNSGTEL